MNEDKRFAVLIDADNISNKYIKYIFDELSNDGIITTYKRIYGDWTTPALGPWKSILLDNSITPVQQYAYTTGKNATDSAMIIDAMDILYTGKVDGFCIVSSDSDFTRLASRLRESGMNVIGMGEKKTPTPFIAACNKFKFLDVLSQNDIADSVSNEDNSGEGQQDKQSEQPESITPLDTILKAISSIVDDISDDDGWSPLSEVGHILTKRFPDFDVRNYKHTKFARFIRSLKIFEEKRVQNNKVDIIYIKRKQK